MADATYEYKIITREDSVWSGKFNPKKVQEALNKFAKDGWRFVGTFTDHVDGGLLNREHDEVIFILEREL